MKKHTVCKNKRLKKGVAIELALLLMVVVFGLCALLVSLTVISNDNSKKQTLSLEQKLLIDQVGTEFSRAVRSGNNFELGQELSETYFATTFVQDGLHQLVLKLNDDEQTVVLTVKLNATDFKVIEWKYN